MGCGAWNTRMVFNKHQNAKDVAMAYLSGVRTSNILTEASAKPAAN
jgi:hypothetical protein